MCSVFIIGTFGYYYIEQDLPNPPGLGDAAYMTIITLSTVGYSEGWPLSPVGKFWTMGVIIFGIATVSYAITSLIALFVSGELRSLHERQKMEKSINQMRDHVILCGYGRMGALVVDELIRCKLDTVIIDNKPDLDHSIHSSKIPFLIGDATDEDLLRDAGVERASALVAALPHDADNIYITLTAQSLNPKMQIIARAEQPSTEPKLMRAGATKVICPQVIGARKVAALLTRPNVVDFVESVSEGIQLEMDEFVISGNSALAGKTLRESLLREKGSASVVAIKRADGETMFNPGAESILAAGDTLILVGPAGVSTRLESANIHQ